MQKYHDEPKQYKGYLKSALIQCGSQVGSIPACAGEPVTTYQSTSRSWVYPRVCGGAQTFTTNGFIDWGLSPRVRGSLHQKHGEGFRPGSIPACAGEPCFVCWTFHGLRVYPRVCGGAMLRLLDVPRAAGLSPRVRGSLAEWTGYSTDEGSIPACAGEPSKVTIRPMFRRVYQRWTPKPGQRLK